MAAMLSTPVLLAVIGILAAGYATAVWAALWYRSQARLWRATAESHRHLLERRWAETADRCERTTK